MIQKLIDLFKPPQVCQMMDAPEEEIRKTYRYWRIRQMYTAFIGYAVFYFVRKNISVAIPVMEKSLGVTKGQIGLVITLGDLVYGLSKFLNGILGDRANPRYFMAFGLIMSAAMNILFGFSSALATFCIIWILNGWFQGMGFPPCARVLGHWFSPGERGTKWAIWNSSHQVGAASILILAGYLAAKDFTIETGGIVHLHLAGWQLCFIVPALISMGVACFIIDRLRDTPGSLGLPPVEEYMKEEEPKKKAECPLDDAAFKKFINRYVFRNKYVWIICLANFFVYILRYAFLNWAPSYLNQVKGIQLYHAGWMTAGFEIAGLLGSLAAGWISDRFLKGRRSPVCVGYMVFAVVALVLFWKVHVNSIFFDVVLLLMLGFFIYGPQFLVGVMTCDVVSKHAAATAIGLTGLFGYASGIISGWGLGWTVEHYGWDTGFGLLVIFAIVAMLLFAMAWNARPIHDEEVEV